MAESFHDIYFGTGNKKTRPSLVFWVLLVAWILFCQFVLEIDLTETNQSFYEYLVVSIGTLACFYFF